MKYFNWKVKGVILNTVLVEGSWNQPLASSQHR